MLCDISWVTRGARLAGYHQSFPRLGIGAVDDGKRDWQMSAGVANRLGFGQKLTPDQVVKGKDLDPVAIAARHRLRAMEAGKIESARVPTDNGAWQAKSGAP